MSGIEISRYSRTPAQELIVDRLNHGAIYVDEWTRLLTQLYYENHTIGQDFMTPPEFFPIWVCAMPTMQNKCLEHLVSRQNFMCMKQEGEVEYLQSIFSVVQPGK